MDTGIDTSLFSRELLRDIFSPSKLKTRNGDRHGDLLPGLKYPESTFTARYKLSGFMRYNPKASEGKFMRCSSGQPRSWS